MFILTRLLATNIHHKDASPILLFLVLYLVVKKRFVLVETKKFKTRVESSL